MKGRLLPVSRYLVPPWDLAVVVEELKGLPFEPLQGADLKFVLGLKVDLGPISESRFAKLWVTNSGVAKFWSDQLSEFSISEHRLTIGLNDSWVKVTRVTLVHGDLISLINGTQIMWFMATSEKKPLIVTLLLVGHERFYDLVHQKCAYYFKKTTVFRCISHYFFFHTVNPVVYML